MKYAKFAALPVVALLAVLAGCASSGSTADSSSDSKALTKVTIGISPFQDTYLPIIGQEKGWFTKAGLDVTLKSLAWNSVMPAVISGDVDMAINNTTGVVSVANADPDVVYAYGWNPFTEGSALMVRPGDNKTVDALEKTLGTHAKARTAAIKALKGKTIVTTLSTDMGKQINDALDSVGMTASDVKFVDMDPDAGLAAFLSGTGDAYLGGIPQRAKALDEGMKIALAGPDLAAPPINGIVTTKQYVADDEPALLSFINVMQRIIRYCDAETKACGTTITDKLNSETAAGLTLAGFTSYWQKIELYAGSAKQTKAMILDEDGVAYWKTTWDSDNTYLVGTKAIPAAVKSSSNFLMPKVWKDYVKKYRENETGY
ncbi:hypothetical protein BH09ACT1_BH09ACT1_20040 [soil metagenome]